MHLLKLIQGLKCMIIAHFRLIYIIKFLSYYYDARTYFCTFPWRRVVSRGSSFWNSQQYANKRSAIKLVLITIYFHTNPPTLHCPNSEIKITCSIRSTQMPPSILSMRSASWFLAPHQARPIKCQRGHGWYTEL